MRNLMVMFDHYEESRLIPNVPTTLLELYVGIITNVHKWHGKIRANILTQENNAIVKYFLIKGATATIDISQIIKYQIFWPILYQRFNTQTRTLIGSLIKILMQPCYQHICSINFDISFDDVIECMDIDLLDIYLNIFKPNPQLLSLIEAIKSASVHDSVKIEIDDNTCPDSFGIETRHIAICEKLLNYGASFHFDTTLLNKVDNTVIIFLIEQRAKEHNKIMNVLTQFNHMHYFPKELIADIVDMSLPIINVNY